MQKILVENTKVGFRSPVQMKYRGKMVLERTGGQGEAPMYDGVLKDTKMGLTTTDVPELHKTHYRGKTQPKKYGQVPYAGKLY